MIHKRPSTSARVLALALLAGPAVQAQYFDGALGTLPEAQGWTFGALGSFSKTAAAGSVTLDTTTVRTTQAGWSVVAANDWDRTNGFSLVFETRLEAESHVSTNRAGFSVILLGSDSRGIELAFWTNTIFAQSDAPLFTHAEESLFAPPAQFVQYRLTLLATNYVLQADGAPILSGPIRDYTAFTGFPSPYQTPNLVFVGDDTTSAAASVSIRRMAVVLPAVLRAPEPGVTTWEGVPREVYHVEASTNLVHWEFVESLSSNTGSLRFQRSPAAPRQFIRVSVP